MKKSSKDIELLAKEMCEVFGIQESKLILLQNVLSGLYIDGVIQGREEVK